MSIGKVVMAALLIVLLLGVIGGACTLSGYNRVVRMNEGVKSAWSQVENQLQRRYDLIPNLVETVKGYAKQEKELFENIAAARTKYFQPGGNPGEKIEAANRMEGLLSRLLVLKETYPELKSNQNFMRLQDSLEGTENRVAVERKRYNDAVNLLNSYVQGFPGRLFAGWAGVQPAKYFETTTPEAKEVPKVKF
ncbi:MAG: LemA family protein [Phycisphaerae bacterium]